MTGFDLFDRFDFISALLFGIAFNGAIVIGAPLWVLVLIIFLCALVGFIHHFDEYMAP